MAASFGGARPPAPAPASGGFSFGAAPPAPAPASSTNGHSFPFPPPDRWFSFGLATDLLRNTGDETLTDVTLIGSDGGRVPAYRLILSVKSEVFKRMLYGNFKEGTSSEVELDYDSEILDAIVEFCCTDRIRTFREKTNHEADEPAARKLVQLCAAAHFFDLPLLFANAQVTAKVLMDERPNLSCAIYDEVGADVSAKQLKVLARDVVVSHPEISLLPDDAASKGGGGVESLRHLSLKELVKDKAMKRVKGNTLICALKRWADKDGSEGSKDIAKDLVAGISLSDVEPAVLLGSVLESGLVEKDLILDTLKQQIGGDVVHVRGAGTHEVNGCYKLDGELNEAPTYSKRGHWEGEDVTFCLYRSRDSRFPVFCTGWCISIADQSASISGGGFNTAKTFYGAPDSDGVPGNNWGCLGLGSTPSPVLSQVTFSTRVLSGCGFSFH